MLLELESAEKCVKLTNHFAGYHPIVPERWPKADSLPRTRPSTEMDPNENLKYWQQFL